MIFRRITPLELTYTGEVPRPLLHDPNNLYDLHGDPAQTARVRWQPRAERSYVSLSGARLPDSEFLPDRDGIFPPSDLEFAKRACETIVVLYQRVVGPLRSAAKEPSVVAE